MLYHVSIHRPKPEYERNVIDSMHRFGAAARTQPGLREVHTLKDRRSDASIGLAVWDGAEALDAARPALAGATEHDDFETWEAAPTEGFLLDEI